jgi:adenylate cyclase
MQNRISRQLAQIYPPGSDAPTQLRTTLAMFASGFTGISVCLYASGLIGFGETLAGVIWLSWGIYSLLAIAIYLRTRRFIKITYVLQSAFCLGFPFVVNGLMGGYVKFGFFGFAMMAPICAIIWFPEQFWRWFAAYVGISLLALAVDPFLRVSPLLPDWYILLWQVASIISSGMMAVLLLWYLLQQRNQSLEQLAQEKALTESLLRNILPDAIAQRLKMNPLGGQFIADHTDEASILFADVVNFTPLSSQVTPQELISLLDRLFTRFDALTDQFGLEKIKTIGDCYMVAAGVPEPQADHAIRITHLALAMQKAMADEKRPDGSPLNIRIGINSGAVVAGVIGRKKFIYDLWGDAVNIASRMESHGGAGIVQVTRATYERICNDFVCEAHGVIEVKGKGATEVWHIIQERH